MAQSKVQLAPTDLLRSSSQLLDRFLFWLEERLTVWNHHLRSWRLQRTFSHVFSRFSYQHPQWVDSLFDEPFLRKHQALILERYLQDRTANAPDELIAAWAAQFNYVGAARRERYADALRPVAVEFLDSLGAEWKVY
jgi:hypothetical protein